ncbi:MAG: 5'/3'-nucleotidase SurE [Solirubrobacteraceae bacterium]
MRVLLTNDDGIGADGIQNLRRALQAVPGVDLKVVAPDGNRSAMARSITTRRPLWVQDIDFGDGTIGYATDGTPVDCVRLASLGLIGGWLPDMVVAGINHGSNIGDDITYSGTVAAALEAVVLGLPGIAVSQQSDALELDFRLSTAFNFAAAAAFTAQLVSDLDSLPLPRGTLLNVNFPGAPPEGVTVARLGKRLYTDALELVEEAPHGRRRYRVYGEAVEVDPEENGTDVQAVAQRRVAVTPLHFDLTYHEGVRALREHDLEKLLTPRPGPSTPRSGPATRRPGSSPPGPEPPAAVSVPSVSAAMSPRAR